MLRRGLALITTMALVVVASIAWAVAAPSAASDRPPSLRDTDTDTCDVHSG